MAFGKVAVLGAGAWGTALALAAARATRQHNDSSEPVLLWGRDPQQIAVMQATRQNARYLPGISLSSSICPTDALPAAVAQADLLLLAVPAQQLRAAMTLAAPHLRPGIAAVICAKGIERETGKFMSEVAAECLPGVRLAVLSGPSFAADVALGLPTAVTIAASRLEDALSLGDRLGSAGFRLYHTDDLRGVEIGGAAKNVLALACGIAHGRELGASAAAALVARAFAELSRFGHRFGARPETLAGLSGLGDLVLTCGSAQSRNFAFGEALGRRGALSPDPRGPVVEGVWTARILAQLAQAHDVDMPIVRSVADILDGRLAVGEAIEGLLARPFRAEHAADQ